MGTGYTRNDTSNNIANGNVIDADDLDGEFNAIESAFNSSTGHTHDGTSSEGAPIEVTGPNQEYVSDATALYPKTDDTYDLGKTGAEWKDLYVDGTANVDTLTADAGTVGGSDIVTTDNTKTLTNKTIDSASNTLTVDLTEATVTGTLAEFNTALSDGNFVSIAGSETLTNKTLTSPDINGGTIDGVTLGTNSAVTEAQVDNINIDGNAITSTDTDGNIALTPNGSGEVDISKVDIDSGTIDDTVIGGTTPAAISGTTGTFSGDLTVDTDTLFVDASTDRVGIGTSSPSQPLQVARSGATAAAIAATNTTGNAYLFLSSANTGTGSIFFGDTDNFQSSLIQYSHNSDNLLTRTAGAAIFQTGGVSERLRIDSSGNVGIGTSSPSALLDVSGDAEINQLTVGRGAGDIGSNTALGYQALEANTTGSSNTAVGREALEANTTGINNAALGFRALLSNTTGSSNTAVGREALEANTTGGGNTVVGRAAGDNVTTGSRNTLLGFACDPSAADGNDQVVVGYALTGKGNDTAFIGGTNGAYNEKNVTTWETTSDQRIKKNIADNNDGLNVISQIQVRNFEYRAPDEITELPSHAAIEQDGTQIGVIAQELQQVLPECVSENSTGVLSVNTDPLVWYLINAVKELKAEIEELKGN